MYPLGPASDTLEICILGDMMMHTAQIENAHRNGQEYDFSSYFRFLEDRIRHADIAIANMEFTLAGEPYSGYPAFSAPDEYATYLSMLGIDVFLTANNHIFDKGAAGAQRTINMFRELGVNMTGIAENQEEHDEAFPLIMKCKGASIAMLNVTYGTNAGIGKEWPKIMRLSEKEAMAEALAKADTCDFVLVLPHWGEEYTLKHSQTQESYARWFVKQGADAIVGAHPHVIQDIQEIDGTPVFYSIGNAVSNMSAANTQMELMVTLKIVRYHNGNIKLLKPEYELLWCSRPGGFCSRYTVLPVEEFIGTRDSWHGPCEYDKMIETRKRIKNILDNE
jgi:poly-gamma-glutamate synthesis protein (capsule biosynthesis protein)